MPVMRCLARMELNGIGFSETECERLKSILQAKLRTLEETAYTMANRSFSLTSPDDVASVSNCFWMFICSLFLEH